MTNWVLEHPAMAVLTAAAVAYLVWHFINTLRLYFWIRNPEREKPRGLGLWATLFDRIGTLEAQNREQKDRYSSMIEDFRHVTDAFPDATLIIDRNARLTWFNSAARVLLNLREQEDIGRPVTNLIHNAEFTHWLDTQSKKEDRLSMTAPGKENTWLDIGAIGIREDQRLIIFRDISEVQNLEQIRKDFVTNVSHELRTPLTVMRGYLEVMQHRPKDELSKPLKRMHKQAIQMQSMLDDLLELSRLQAVEPLGEEEYVEIPFILQQLREQAEEISRGNHELRFEVDEGLALTGIRDDLESAFRNLIVNALKYTPEGGKITVRWHDIDESPTLTVSDTGIGIPKREIPRLTERFYRVGSDRGRKSGGTGLGLAIVKHILNEHQARLVIHSDYGVGSQFACIFPPERKRA